MATRGKNYVLKWDVIGEVECGRLNWSSNDSELGVAWKQQGSRPTLSASINSHLSISYNKHQQSLLLAPWSSSRPITGVIWCSKADLEWPLQGHFNFLKCGLKEQVYPEKEIVWFEIDLTIGMDHQLFVPDNFLHIVVPNIFWKGRMKIFGEGYLMSMRRTERGKEKKIFFQEAGVSGNNLGAWEREWEWLIPFPKFGDGFEKIHSPSSYHCHSQHQQQNDLNHHQRHLCSITICNKTEQHDMSFQSLTSSFALPPQKKLL